tara:strand:+ start:379 stop:633 length:255 start_codon:yes stop_codon:yes gene_type:complete
MKLKNPIDLIIYPRQPKGIGIYSLAKLENDEICAVSYCYETESWEVQPNKWIKIIMDTKTERVSEEILDLNGLGKLIHKIFNIK